MFYQNGFVMDRQRFLHCVTVCILNKIDEKEMSLQSGANQVMSKFLVSFHHSEQPELPLSVTFTRARCIIRL